MYHRDFPDAEIQEGGLGGRRRLFDLNPNADVSETIPETNGENASRRELRYPAGSDARELFNPQCNHSSELFQPINIKDFLMSIDCELILALVLV